MLCYFIVRHFCLAIFVLKSFTFLIFSISLCLINQSEWHIYLTVLFGFLATVFGTSDLLFPVNTFAF